MIELPVFVSYRRVDGSNLALSLREALRGRTVLLRRGVDYLATVSPFVDILTPATEWRSDHDARLCEAHALIVIVTAGTKHEFVDEEDFLYREIRWWIQNRRDNPPLLVAPPGIDQRWVPNPVQEHWPNAQIVAIPVVPTTALNSASEASAMERCVQRLLTGIELRSQRTSAAGVELHSAGAILNSKPPLHSWEKDRLSRYVRVDERYAEAAGYDSPHAMVGKTDADMPWRKLAELFRAGDREVMRTGRARSGSPETEIMVNRTAPILVWESPVRDQFGDIVGVQGHFVDMTELSALLAGPGAATIGGTGLPMWEYSEAALSAGEVDVLGMLLQGKQPFEIAALLAIRNDEVRAHLDTLKRAFQAATDGELIRNAFEAGVHFYLFGTAISFRPNAVTGEDQ